MTAPTEPDLSQAVTQLMKGVVYRDDHDKAWRSLSQLQDKVLHEPALFAAPLGLKDVRLVLAAADTLGVPLPTAGLAHDNLLAAIAAGRGGEDWTVAAAMAQERAGLDRRK